MSTHRFALELEIDDEALAEHDGEASPPPNDPADWNAPDLAVAIQKGFVKNLHDAHVVHEQVN